MKQVLAAAMVVVMASGCATQHYGRQSEVSEVEKELMDCKDLRIDIARTEQFLASVRNQRDHINTAHVMGAMGDFGIGNSLEGDAAELSGEQRLKELQALKAAKPCV